jgi:SAM-dependent methyltransferase
MSNQLVTPLIGQTHASATIDRAPRNCPVCGSTAGQGRNLLGQLVSKRWKTTYDLILCPVCELIFLSPLPGKNDFVAMYVVGKQFDDAAYRGDRAKVAHEYYRRCVEALLSYQNKPPDAPHRVLEIGAGLGWISYAAKSLCPQSLTIAQDISPEVVHECTWIDQYFVHDLETSVDDILRLGPFHVIAMTHVIEHLPDPITVLNICRKLLAPEGIVFVTAPHRPPKWDPQAPFSVWEQWSYNHVPAHLQYFNENSLRRCAFLAHLTMPVYSAASEEGQAFEAWLRHPAE